MLEKHIFGAQGGQKKWEKTSKTRILGITGHQKIYLGGYARRSCREFRTLQLSFLSKNIEYFWKSWFYSIFKAIFNIVQFFSKSILNINHNLKADPELHWRQNCREFQALQLWFYREMPRCSSFFNFYLSFIVFLKKIKILGWVLWKKRSSYSVRWFGLLIGPHHLT